MKHGPRQAHPTAAVRSEGTRPELRVRAALRKMGLKFRANARDLPGTPDVVIDEAGTVVMVHGCFWHVHAGCRRGLRVPNALWRRHGYWAEKLVRNVLRDRRVEEELEAAGWKVVVVWECETARRTLRSLCALLRARGVVAPRSRREVTFRGQNSRLLSSLRE